MIVFEHDVRVILAAAVILAGCGEGNVDGSATTVRDSAGTTIVHSSSPLWEDADGWRVADGPAVRIGTVEGPEPYQLFGVRDATVLSDGRIVLVNSDANDVRIFADDGRHLRTFGREGEGPGEFNYPLRIFRLPGDSMAVVDFRRISVFDAGGAFVRSHNYRPPRPDDRLEDGRFLAAGFAAGVNPVELGHARPDWALIVSRPGTSNADTVAVVPGTESYRLRVARSIVNALAPFGRVRSFAANGSRIVTGDGTTFQVTVLEGDGSVARVFRRDAGDLALRAEDVARYEEAFVNEFDDERTRRIRARIVREASYPDRKPAYDRLVVDDVGNIWARHYVAAGEPRRWTVFATSGRWLGVVTMPAGLEVLEIGDDYVLGSAEGPLGVEYVQLHDLHKAGQGEDEPL